MRCRSIPLFIKYSTKSILVLVLLIFYLPKESLSQPFNDSKEGEENYARKILDRCPEMYYSFAERLELSNDVISGSNAIIRGSIVDKEFEIKNDSIFEILTFKVKHMFRGDTIHEGKIVEIKRAVEAKESLIIEDGKVVNTNFFHSYELGLYKEYEYIIFCKETADGFRFFRDHRMSFLARYSENKNVWIGLCGHIYTSLGRLQNHFSQIGEFRLMNDRENSRGSLNRNLMRINDFYPKTLSAGTGDVLTIEGQGFGAFGKVLFTSAENDGPGSFSNPFLTDLDPTYLDWSDNLIRVVVPSQAYEDIRARAASSGVFKVINGESGEERYSYDILGLTREEVLAAPELHPQTMLNITFSNSTISPPEASLYGLSYKTVPALGLSHCDGIFFSFVENELVEGQAVFEEALLFWDNILPFNLGFRRHNDEIYTTSFSGTQNSSLGLAPINIDDNILGGTVNHRAFPMGEGNMPAVFDGTDVIFNSIYSFDLSLTGDVPFDFSPLYDVAIHELGHVIGLGHSRIIDYYTLDEYGIIWINVEDQQEIMKPLIRTVGLAENERATTLDGVYGDRLLAGRDWIIDYSDDLILSQSFIDQAGVKPIANGMFTFPSDEYPLEVDQQPENVRIYLPDIAMPPFAYIITKDSYDGEVVLVNETVLADDYDISFSIYTTDPDTQQEITREPGTYCISIEDSNDCGDAQTCFELVECNLAAEFVKTPPCEGESNGSITPVVSNSQGELSFLWTWSVDDQEFTSESLENIPGTGLIFVNVLITDLETGCTFDSGEEIIRPGPRVITEITPACSPMTGSIALDFIDSPPPHNVSWSNGQTGNTINSLDADTYYATLTDGTGCSRVESYVVSGAPMANLTSLVDCICELSPIQAFNLTVEGNPGQLDFQWMGPQGYSSTEYNPTDITVAGEYTVEITDINGCTVVLEEEIIACTNTPESLTFQVQPNCPSNGGNITTTVIGGELPLSYEWSGNFGDVANPNNVEAGSYTVTVTDANGCSIEGTVEVPIPENPPFEIVTEDIGHACTESSGYISLDMTGIAEPYAVQWSLSGETEHRISALTNGNYYVTVTDANGCYGTEMFTIYGAPSFNHFVFPESCEPANDGRIELVANNDPLPEEVSIAWSNGATNVLVIDNLNGGAGTYSVTITGVESGCEVVKGPWSLAPTIESGEAPYLKSLRVTAIQGTTETLIYKGDWVETSSGCVKYIGGSQNMSQELVDAMGAGSVSWRILATYNQFVSDGTISFVSQLGSITRGIAATNETQIIPLDDAQVAGLIGTSGSFELTIESFASSPVGGPTINMFDYSGGLVNCVNIPSTNPVTCDYEPPLDHIGVDPTHSLSFQCIDVAMTVSGDDTFCVDIGATPENHVQAVYWRIPSGDWILSPTNDRCFQVTNDLFGEYCSYIKVATDASECVVEVCGNYCALPTNLSVTENVTAPTCTSANDGTICLDIDTDPGVSFIVVWETGEIGNCLENLSAGTYTYTLQPSGECDLMPNDPVLGPHSIELGIDNSSLEAVEALTPSCDGEVGNGEACVYGFGGTPPYDIIWEDGSTANCIRSLAAGEYTYTLTDACGATITSTVEVEAVETGDIAIALPGPDSDACVTHLQFYLTTPTLVTVTITHNETGASFSQVITPTGGPNIPSYPVLVRFDDIPLGAYTVEIVDQCGNVLQAFTEPAGGKNVYLISGIEHHGFIRCEGGTGMLTVHTFEDGEPPYSILWSNGETTATIDNLDPGIYIVTVTDANGCTASHGLTLDIRDPLVVDAEVTEVCSESNGRIELVVEGGVSPYTFNWSNGATEQNLTGVDAGEYCVTVTDAADCVVKDCYTVIKSDLEVISEVITDHECGIGEGCNGAIDLAVESSLPISYQWSNGATTQDITGLCGGMYGVTITSGECTEIRAFEIGAGEITDWDFSYIVESGFYDSSTLSNDAELAIFSELFNNDDFWESSLIVSYQTSLSFDIVDDPSFRGGLDGRRIEIRIDENYSDYERFYFAYITPDGCVYRGEILITNCNGDETSLLRFELDPLGDETQSCEPGQTHDYYVNIIQIGTNYPYYIDVTMESASYPEDVDYHQTVVIENAEAAADPILVTGIPPGRVRFYMYHVCGTLPLSSGQEFHNNCCLRLGSCDYVSSGTHDNFGGGEYFDFPYFRFTTYQECFENDCGPLSGNDCSNIEITFGAAPLANCWTGTITINYPEESHVDPLVLVVVDGGTGHDQVVQISGDDNWMPPGEGFYDFTITYTGTDESMGQDCSTTLQVEFFGPEHNSTHIGFLDEFGFTGFLGATEEFTNSYYRTYLCEICGPLDLVGGNSDYLWGLPEDECDGPTLNPYASNAYFRFTPDPSGTGEPTDPCNAGGWLTIFVYDENGTPIEESVRIEPTPDGETENPSLPGMRPLWLEQGQHCDIAGWCLFDFMDVYGFQSVDGKRLLASWALPESCGPLPDPEFPDPDIPPCDDETNPCPGDLVCVNGACEFPCEEDSDCFYGGTCVDGVCLEEEPPPGSDICDPSCLEGFECVNNECVPIEDICNVSVVGAENQTFTYYHNFPEGTVIRFMYRAFSPPNSFQVAIDGQVQPPIVCAENDNWESVDYTLTGNTVTVAVAACSGDDSSTFSFRIRCPNGINDTPDNVDFEQSDNNDINVYPNPFNETLTLSTTFLIQAFDGEVVVLDFQGGEVSRAVQYFEEGHNSFSIDTPANLVPGMYTILVIKNGQLFASKRVLKM